ncbi:hypothetical protein ALC53_02584 [Atta colombica]|uniref:Uncharacterized protein n=1 Tax=Atta colombica TaxID=520822 RepID=A0A195BRH8_9HYME|nr:hypothetical protein ALC53_02584 [Atta colombica]
MDYGFGGALVLHVGRQRGDKNPVSQCIAVVVATTAAAAAAAAAVNGGVVRQAGGASGWQRDDNAVINTSAVRNDRRDLGTSRSAEVVTAKATGAITDKRSNRTVRKRPLLLMGWTMERHGCRESKSMTNGRPLGKVLCIAEGRTPKFRKGRLRRADLGVGQAEKQELRARSGALARGYRKP